jgi:thiamine-phosphate pyrophosphorylase
LLGGNSVHAPDAAKHAQTEGADYLVFGPVFETETHPGAISSGVQALADVVSAVSIPVIAIGGITADRVPEVLATGARGIAVIRAIIARGDARAAAAELRAAIDGARAPA